MQALQASITHEKKKRIPSYNIPHQTHVHQPTIPARYHKVCATKENNVCDLTIQRFPQFSYCVLFYAP
jgi:hypothetical protein